MRHQESGRRSADTEYDRDGKRYVYDDDLRARESYRGGGSRVSNSRFTSLGDVYGDTTRRDSRYGTDSPSYEASRPDDWSYPESARYEDRDKRFSASSEGYGDGRGREWRNVDARSGSYAPSAPFRAAEPSYGAAAGINADSRRGDHDRGRGGFFSGGNSTQWSGGGSYSDTRAGAHRGKGPKGYTRSDDRLQELISERLMEDPSIDASDVTVSVSGQTVTLDGTVDSRRTKYEVEECAEHCGAADVINNLKISRSRSLTGNEESSDRK